MFLDYLVMRYNLIYFLSLARVSSISSSEVFKSRLIAKFSVTAANFKPSLAIPHLYYVIFERMLLLLSLQLLRAAVQYYI